MQARAPLMIEHRLIERMIAVIKPILVRIENEKEVNPIFIDTTVDFIRVYADRTHHGKEEDILFRDLEGKALHQDHRQLMEELIEDHVLGRKTTGKLVEANHRYRNGEGSAIAEIASSLSFLTDFYPKHIKKEDKVFFPAVRAYFSGREEQALLDEFREFDRKMIHEKYIAMVEAFEYP